MKKTPDSKILQTEGYFCNNGSLGFGVSKAANGDVYTGQFKRGRRHGFGRMCYANGDLHSGWWIADRPGGLGTLATERGALYVGYWDGSEPLGDGLVLHFANLKHSFGPEWQQAAKQALADRATERRWGHRRGISPRKATWLGPRDERNKPCGAGVMTRFDGVVVQGTARGGRLTGTGVMHYPDGTAYSVTFDHQGRVVEARPCVSAARPHDGAAVKKRELSARLAGLLQPVDTDEKEEQRLDEDFFTSLV